MSSRESKLLGNEFETLDDVKKELIRRAAILDFLALYQEARKDDVVERVKHIIHAKDFLEFKPKHLEIYITRLLGRCLRAHCPGHNAVSKERNSFKYSVNVVDQWPQFRQIIDMQKIINLSYPYNPIRNYYYGYRGNDRMRRYEGNGQLYWRTRGLVDPTSVDAMYAAWNAFSDRVGALERVQMTGWDHVMVHYGNPGFVGRNRWYKPYNNPSYFSYEAYSEFKQWIEYTKDFVENQEDAINTSRILADHDRSDDPQIEEDLQANEHREMEYLRERAREMAAERAGVEVDEIEEEELDEIIYVAPEVEEGTTGDTLQNRLYAKLREKGLMR